MRSALLPRGDAKGERFTRFAIAVNNLCHSILCANSTVISYAVYSAIAQCIELHQLRRTKLVSAKQVGVSKPNTQKSGFLEKPDFSTPASFRVNCAYLLIF